MKYIVIFAMLFTLIYGGVTTKAHFLQTSNGIGGVIHVEPNDQPLVGVDTQMYIELKDTNNRLSETNCKCTIEIKKNGVVTSSSNPDISKTNDGSILVSQTVQFPEKGVYQVVLIGTAKQQEFDQFTLVYDIRADRGIESLYTNPNWIIGGVIFIGILVAIFWFKLR